MRITIKKTDKTSPLYNFITNTRIVHLRIDSRLASNFAFNLKPPSLETVIMLLELIFASLMNAVNLAMLIDETRRRAKRSIPELKTPRGSIVFRRTMALPPIPE